MSLSHIKTRHGYGFLLHFPHEFLMRVFFYTTQNNVSDTYTVMGMTTRKTTSIRFCSDRSSSILHWLIPDYFTLAKARRF